MVALVVAVVVEVRAPVASKRRSVVVSALPS